MAYSLNAIFLLLWFLQQKGWQVTGQNFSVQQKSLIEVAFVNELVQMICEVSFPNTMEYSTFTIRYYRVGSEDKRVTIKEFNISETIPSGEEYKIAKKSYTHKIGPLGTTSATGTYYCQAKWKNKTCKGNGIFILVRDTGYTEASPGMWKFLIALTTLLAILSITETAVLLWKRKCLESHQADVYSVLENDTNSLSLEKKPTAKLQDMVSSQPDRVGNRNEDYGKAGKRKKKKETKSQQETPEEPFDMLYENI